MTKKEFYEKHGLHFKDVMDEMLFLGGLDKLYLEFTKEQAIAIVNDYLDNADDIYNELQENISAAIKELAEVLKQAQEKKDEEDFLDKNNEA